MYRETLNEIYLDYINNYISVDIFGEHNGLTAMQAVKLLVLAKEIHYSQHPES
jgi:hypothetical protein